MPITVEDPLQLLDTFKCKILEAAKYITGKRSRVRVAFIRGDVSYFREVALPTLLDTITNIERGLCHG